MRIGHLPQCHGDSLRLQVQREGDYIALPETKEFLKAAASKAQIAIGESEPAQKVVKDVRAGSIWTSGECGRACRSPGRACRRK